MGQFNAPFMLGGICLGSFILEMQNITKLFPGVRALDNVNLQVEKGEIHALVGENGAGKSTLMNVLSGIHRHGTYDGSIMYKGEECKFKDIRDSETKGIAKALAKDVELLILDEPTASLNETDSQKLLNLLLQFKKEGLTSIIISHKLNEIEYIADKITIIRDGGPRFS